MDTLELFSGTESFSNVALERGHNTITIDNSPHFNAMHITDILKIDKEYICEYGLGEIDVLWSSPPCTTFSMAGRSSNYTDHVPNSVKACIGLALVYKTLDLIRAISPRYWFIENPMAYLRTFPMMRRLHRKTVTYCQYGDIRMKPTDIWTNLIEWIPQPKCKNGDKCHEAAPRGSKTGTQGMRNAMERGAIPPQLFHEIFDVIEGKIGTSQSILDVQLAIEKGCMTEPEAIEALLEHHRTEVIDLFLLACEDDYDRAINPRKGDYRPDKEAEWYWKAFRQYVKHSERGAV